MKVLFERAAKRHDELIGVRAEQVEELLARQVGRRLAHLDRDVEERGSLLAGQCGHDVQSARLLLLVHVVVALVARLLVFAAAEAVAAKLVVAVFFRLRLPSLSFGVDAGVGAHYALGDELKLVHSEIGLFDSKMI